MSPKRFIYADNAATSPLSEKALEAMLPFMRQSYANASQPYSFAREAKKALQRSREIIAESIGAKSSEVFFTSGGTESNNWVIRGAVDQKRNIITTPIEHHSILRAVEYAISQGRETKYIAVDREGLIDTNSLNTAIQASNSLVSVVLANNEIGTIQDIASIADIAHSNSCIIHTDAVQAIGHIPVNVREMNVDYLSASAHKFNGPKGIGFLYKKESTNITPLLFGGAQEKHLRAGTENIACIVGMATALEEHICHLESNISTITLIENTLINELNNLGVRFKRNGASNHVPGNISLSFEDIEGETLLHRLDLMGIMVSTGSACDSKETQISHVLNAINLDNSLARGTIRVSFGTQNASEEAIEVARAIKNIIRHE